MRMDNDEIYYAIQTVRAAHLFYDFGKLDRLLMLGITESANDLYEIYYELLDAASDYMQIDFDDAYEVNHWYFSFQSMLHYYRLAREYGCLHSMKLKNNPYIISAEQALHRIFYECSSGGGLGWDYQKKISSEWASGIIIETDAYFHSEYELLEALLSVDAFYKEETQKLETVLKKERLSLKQDVLTLEAA